jgi:CRISPR-associated protein Csx17
LRNIEDSILGVCREATASRWQRLLVALGQAEKQMVKSRQTTESSFLQPLPRLRAQWLKQADDGSPEFRLAASLASIYDRGQGPIRANMTPLDLARYYPAFKKGMDDNSVVWGEGKLAENLLAVLQRRLLEYRMSDLKELPLKGKQPADLDDVRVFIEGAVDEEKIEGLLWGLNAIDWPKIEPAAPRARGDDLPVPAAYALLKLTHHPGPVRFDWKHAGVELPLDPSILARARTGELSAACQCAAGRLKASGLVPKTDALRTSPEMGKRIAAALLFPLGDRDIMYLARTALKRPSLTG